MTQSQTDAVLAHLKSGATLTPLEALERYGCLRLAARIENLRQCGYRIKTRMEYRGRKHWATYYLPADDERCI